MAWQPLPNQCDLEIFQELTTSNSVNIAQYDKGYAEIARDGYNEFILQWSLRYKPLSLANRSTIIAFLLSVGEHTIFYVSPENAGGQIAVRMVKDSLKESLVKDKYIISLKVQKDYSNG